MRRRITLEPSEEYAFDISRNALVLVLREATQNVVFKGDSLTPIELSRSDILDIQLFRNKRMFLANEGSTPITVEFQLSDTPISIREQRMSVEGGVVIDEIAKPVTVSEIQTPVSVRGTVPVNVQNALSVAFPDSPLNVIEKKVHTDRFFVVGKVNAGQNIHHWQSGSMTTHLTIQADLNNAESVFIGGRDGLELPPGAAFSLPDGVGNVIQTSGNASDVIRYALVRERLFDPSNPYLLDVDGGEAC